MYKLHENTDVVHAQMYKLHQKTEVVHAQMYKLHENTEVRSSRTDVQVAPEHWSAQFKQSCTSCTKTLKYVAHAQTRKPDFLVTQM
jgi:hypothetical protein